MWPSVFTICALCHIIVIVKAEQADEKGVDGAADVAGSKVETSQRGIGIKKPKDLEKAVVRIARSKVAKRGGKKLKGKKHLQRSKGRKTIEFSDGEVNSKPTKGNPGASSDFHYYPYSERSEPDSETETESKNISTTLLPTNGNPGASSDFHYYPYSERSEPDSETETESKNIPTTLLKAETSLTSSEEQEQLQEIEGISFDDMFEPDHPKEKELGDIANFFGTNPHTYVPQYYKDFGRRFVLQYPYTEKQPASKLDIEAESALDLVVKEAKQNEQPVEAVEPVEPVQEFVPKKAPKNMLVAIAKEGATLALATVEDEKKKLEQAKHILRSGNSYWDDYVVEYAKKPNMDKYLRSLTNLPRSDNDIALRAKLNVVRVKVMPGSKLHEIVSVAKSISPDSPRLLYIINNRQNEQ